MYKRYKKGADIMPIRIDDELPAKQNLEIENIFVMSKSRANMQDIRPLKIIILNLMPTKLETETQLLRLLSNSLCRWILIFFRLKVIRLKMFQESIWTNSTTHLMISRTTSTTE